MIGLHFDVLYTIPGVGTHGEVGALRWRRAELLVSHRGVDSGDINGEFQEDENRFDFSEFDWDAGLNFIVGAKTPSGAFFELKATSYGAATVRMLAGFEF